MATLLDDDFNRANSTNVPGTPTTGGPWTVVTGTWGINGNAMYTSASVAESQITAPGAFDIDITMVVSVFGNTGVMFRRVDANNYWLAYVAAGEFSLYSRRAGVLTSIRSTSLPNTAPITVRVVAYGEYIWVFRNGVLIHQIIDPFTSGSPSGIGFRHSSNTAGRFNSILAVDAAAIPSATHLDGALDYDLDTESTHPIDGTSLYKGRDTKVLDDAEEA